MNTSLHESAEAPVETESVRRERLAAPSVSIVVPVFGVEKYVGRCFDSVAAQTYPFLECIFVDDCGTDASMRILRERIAAYRGHVRFRIVRHERNRGLSAARNTGADAATGEYVWFVDSDDFISDDAVADIFGKIGAARPEVISFNYANFTDGDDFSGRLVRVPAYDDVGGILDAICVSRHENWGAQFRIFQKEFLIRENLRFHEGLIHEDVDFLLNILRTGTRSVLTDNHCVYFYRGSRAGSIMASGFPEKRMRSLFLLAEKSYGFALAHDANFRIYVEVFREMLFSFLNGCSSRKTAKRGEFLKMLRARKKDFAALLRHSPGRRQKIVSFLLPSSVFATIFAWRALSSFPVVCLLFARRKIKQRFSR